MLERIRPDSTATISFRPLELCADTLAETLPEGWQVFWAVRNGSPGIRRVLRQIEASGASELSVLPMHPEYSPAATGRVMADLYRALRRSPQLNLTTCTTWYDDSGYVNAQARLVAEYATTQGLTPDKTQLVFSAVDWGTASVLERSPYEEQVRRSARLISDRVGWPADRVSVTFGEPTDPLSWISRESFGEDLLVCSLDVLSCAHRVVPFETSGERVHVCPALAAYEPFITAVKNLILRGPRPIVSESTSVKPLLVPSLKPGEMESQLESLIMVGTCLPGRVRSRRGPYLMHSDPQLFRSVKKSRKELRKFLDWAREQPRVSEGFVWNTCQRVEFYGWLADPHNVAEREYVIAQVRRRLYGAASGDLKVNVLFGAEAWHHLMRTVSGLNSELPGDADLVGQLQTSSRVAERTGAAGLRAARLVGTAVNLSGEVRAKTMWGRFSPGYCLAALSRVCDVDGARLDENRHVVIGGSATSRSILLTLSESFRVPQRMMTLVYRDHHGQMKLLRSALGHGKRVRVHCYADPRVLTSIADADLVFFGIDNAEPVLDLEKLTNLRDFSLQPLTIIDFNSFGSMSGANAPDGVTVWTARELDRAVAAYAEAMSSQEQFSAAVEEAENWIESRIPVDSWAESKRNAAGGPSLEP
jgi:glutamyl-tRNA reductase